MKRTAGFTAERRKVTLLSAGALIAVTRTGEFLNSFEPTCNYITITSVFVGKFAHYQCSLCLSDAGSVKTSFNLWVWEQSAVLRAEFILTRPGMRFLIAISPLSRKMRRVLELK